MASTNIQVVFCGRFSSVYCIVDLSSYTLSCSPAAFTRRVTVRRGCYEVLFCLGELGRETSVEASSLRDINDGI